MLSDFTVEWITVTGVRKILSLKEEEMMKLFKGSTELGKFSTQQ